MDNLTFQRLKIKLQQIQENKAFQKLVEHRQQIKNLVQTAPYNLLMDYLRESLSLYQQALVNEHENGKGKDISDIIRGKILAINDMLNVETVIDSYLKFTDKMKETEKELAERKGA